MSRNKQRFNQRTQTSAVEEEIEAMENATTTETTTEPETTTPVDVVAETQPEPVQPAEVLPETETPDLVMETESGEILTESVSDESEKNSEENVSMGIENSIPDEISNQALTDELSVPEVTEEIYVSDTPDVVNPIEEEKQWQEKITVAGMDQETLMQTLHSTTAKMSIQTIVRIVSEIKRLNDNFHVMSRITGVITNQGPSVYAELFQNIKDLIEKTDNHDFQLSMDFVLNLFYRCKDNELNYVKLCRYSENLPLNAVDVALYPKLMRLLTVAASDPVNRMGNLANLDFSRILEFGFSDQARSRIMMYFNA